MMAETGCILGQEREPFSSDREDDEENEAEQDEQIEEQQSEGSIENQIASENLKPPPMVSNTAPFVEDRLNRYSKIYQEKRQRRAEEQDPRKETRSPAIDQVSAKIVAADSSRISRVEDRLLQRQNMQKEEIKKEAKVKPKGYSQRNQKQVVERLYECQKKYAQKREERKKKREEKEQCSFRPKVNSDFNSQIHPTHHSNSPAKVQTEEPKWSFHPNISKNSQEIAKKKGTHQERILSARQIPSAHAAPAFTPTVDPVSSAIDNRKKVAHQERWEHLYELKEKQNTDMDELKKQYEETDPALQECTFHPTLIASVEEPQEKNEKAVEDVQMRTMKWLHHKNKKIQALRENGEDKDLQECTFKPQLVASPNPGEKEEQSEADAEGFIASMQSVEAYIERQKILRNQKEELKKKVDNSAGSGNVWTKKLTVPRAPQFQTKVEKEELKALSKPISISASSGEEELVRHHRAYPKSDAHRQYVAPTHKPDLAPEKGLNPIAEKLEFNQALQMLHKNLMQLDIENPNFQ